MNNVLPENTAFAIGGPTPVISVSPVVLTVPDRVVDLQMRISAPRTGHALPIILLSHGHGGSNNLSSLNGYGPLAQYWAAHGFVVIQPTHLDSKTLSRDPRIAHAPEAPLFWRSRVLDMQRILDQLAVIEAAVPEITGRLDHRRVAVVGHSMGGHTAGMLLGAQLTEADGTQVNLAEPRIKAGALLAAPGNGGTDLSAFATAHYPFFSRPSFAPMTTPALVVMGDQDVSPHLTVRGADWYADPYHLSTGPKSLLTLFGGGTCWGAFRATMPRKRPTRTRSAWPWWPSSRRRTCAPRSTQRTPAGRRPARHCGIILPQGVVLSPSKNSNSRQIF